MFYEPPKDDHGLPYNPFKALVAPRPIGWITTMSLKGEVNLSPYSYFNAVSDRPDIVAFSSHGRKDALVFAEETGEFVCNLATFDLREAMNRTSAPLPRGESALECKWLRTVPLAPLAGPAQYHLVIGEVVGIHIDDRFIVDGVVDTAAMRPIARAGYREYFVATPGTSP